MIETGGSGRLEFGGAARYRIVVQGELTTDWASRVCGMVVTVRGGHAEPCTTLVGTLRDQTELNGVLETLYSLRRPLVQVEKLEQGC